MAGVIVKAMKYFISAIMPATIIAVAFGVLFAMSDSGIIKLFLCALAFFMFSECLNDKERKKKQK